MSAIALRPKNTWLLIRNGLSVARTPAILIAAGSGVAFILYVLTSIGGGSQEFHMIVYPIMLILFGYVISSFAFQEVHDPRAGIYALTNPGSILEKYVARLLLTSIGWTVAVTAAYMLTTLIGAGVSELAFGESHGIFVPNSRFYWEFISGYLVTQAVFLFGSIYFKKSALLKTILMMVLIVIVYAVFFFLAWRVVYWNMFTRFFPSEAEVNLVMAAIEPHVNRLGNVLMQLLKYVRWIAVPIFFWIAGYLRLRETEV